MAAFPVTLPYLLVANVLIAKVLTCRFPETLLCSTIIPTLDPGPNRQICALFGWVAYVPKLFPIWPLVKTLP